MLVSKSYGFVASEAVLTVARALSLAPRPSWRGHGQGYRNASGFQVRRS